jgi:hypothetical protein
MPSTEPDGSGSGRRSIRNGSAVALMIFALVTAAHLRVYRETGAKAWVLVLALAVIGITLLTFIVTTLADEPASIVTLLAILLLSVGLDAGWSRKRKRMEIRRG